MNSRTVRKLGHEYVEGTLPREQMLAIQRHLETSPRDRAYIEELESLQSIFGEWEAPEPSDHFAKGVLDRIRANSRDVPHGHDPTAPVERPTRVWSVPRYVAAAAILLLVSSLSFNVVSLLDRGPDPGERSRYDGFADSELRTYPGAEPWTPVSFDDPPVVSSAFYYYLDPTDIRVEDADELDGAEIGP